MLVANAHLIRDKEEHGDEAVKRSAERVRDVGNRFVENIRLLVDRIGALTAFYATQATTLEETGRKIEYFKAVIENQDG